jgi:alkylated DNA nucleotide flippase Atl1
MKNQYFGDINDYRKYGLLRTLTRETGLRCLVAWMLTPDDGRTDGRMTRYLEDADAWRGYDPALFNALRRYVIHEEQRDIGLLQRSGLLPNARFYSNLLPERRHDRKLWFGNLLSSASNCGLVFLDPDNGIEVPSTPLGTRTSTKYVYWRELKRLFDRGHSVLVYQHFPRKDHDQFAEERAIALTEKLDTDHIYALKTSHVVFLLAPQIDHDPAVRLALESFARTWRDQIRVTEFRRQGESRRIRPPAIGVAVTRKSPHGLATPAVEDRTPTPAGRRTGESPNTPKRASQVWQILVHVAANHATITYGDLAKLMGIGSARGMGRYLDPIMRYCDANGLPPLHVLAVSKTTGVPGKGLRIANFETERDRVFDFNWFELAPPRPEDLSPPLSR